MSGEARHVAFGVFALAELDADMSDAELKERQDFLRKFEFADDTGSR